MTTENQGVFVQASNTTQSLGAGGLGTLTVAACSQHRSRSAAAAAATTQERLRNAEGGKEVTRG